MNKIEGSNFIFTREYAKSLFYSKVDSRWTDYVQTLGKVFEEDERYMSFVKKRPNSFFEILGELIVDKKVILLTIDNSTMIKRFVDEGGCGVKGNPIIRDPIANILKFQRIKVRV